MNEEKATGVIKTILALKANQELMDAAQTGSLVNMIETATKIRQDPTRWDAIIYAEKLIQEKRKEKEGT